MAYRVRKAMMDDLPRIWEIYNYARCFMAENGNPDQWGTVHPPKAMLENDIRQGSLYCIEDERGIHGSFAFFLGEDPTYREIFEGKWHYDTPYGTIHRIAGDGSHGILHSCVEFCTNIISHLRIDTHEDNHVMQGAVKKEGFQYCGIIYIENGDPRLAYDLLTE